MLDRTNEHGAFSSYKDPRPWTQITGITLHQTACWLGTRPARWDTLRAHIGIPSDGQIILEHPLTRVVWHAHGYPGYGLSWLTAGIEIDGNFRGIEGKDSTAWSKGGGPHTPTSEQIASAKEAVRWIIEEVAKNGGKVEFIAAHRQSYKDREADPGSMIWQEVGLWAMVELGLTANPMMAWGNGFAIPVEWDPRSVRNYRNKLVPERVKWYQELIGFTGKDIDGDHGGGTTRRLKEWQKEHDLEPTGEVDGSTFSVLETL